MARILIVGGGCRGRQLAAALAAEGDAVRITTRAEPGRAAIEAIGAECWIGTPDRLATLRGTLENVAIACWLLATATGTDDRVRALHGSRLQYFLGEVIDTTVRGFVYEAGGAAVAPQHLADGARIVASIGRRNAIPVATLGADPRDIAAWLAEAQAAVRSLLEGP